MIFFIKKKRKVFCKFIEISKIIRDDQKSKSLVILVKIFLMVYYFSYKCIIHGYAFNRPIHCRKTEVPRILSNAVTRRKVSFWFYDVYSCCQLVFSRKSCFTHLCITSLIATCLSIIRYILTLST